MHAECTYATGSLVCCRVHSRAYHVVVLLCVPLCVRSVCARQIARKNSESLEFYSGPTNSEWYLANENGE